MLRVIARRVSTVNCNAVPRKSLLGVRPYHNHKLKLHLGPPSMRRPCPTSHLVQTSHLQRIHRQASTSSETATEARSLVTRLKNLVLGTSVVLFLTFGYLYVTDTRAGIHQWLVVPSLRWIYDDAEEAHHVGTKALRTLYDFGLHPRERGNPDGRGDLQVEVFGHTLSNPIATSAGIDKHASIPSPLLALGPAIIEVGGVTPYPQDGNPKPRVFRLPSQNALINRYGLNSEGAEFVAMRLRQRVREFAHSLGLGIDQEAERKVLDGEAGVPPGSLTPGKLMAVQVAKNRFTPGDDIEAVKSDYVFCVEQLAPYADIIVVNVSSPNTPGLRSLQREGPLTGILSAVVDAAKSTKRRTKPAVMVKVSPDEDSEAQVQGICDAVRRAGVDGVIVGNTTNRRPSPVAGGFTLPRREAQTLLEQGGYSGPQLFERTVPLVKKYRAALDASPAAEQAQPTSSPPAADKRDTAAVPAPDAAPRPGEHQETQALEKMVLSPSSAPSRQLGAAAAAQQPTVIFATGGITNGRQAQEVLDAGASVAMVYTAVVMGGVGTISRIKSEMRAARNGREESKAES